MKLAVAPINWTNDDLPELGKEISFDQCIVEMAQAGYTGCEVGTKFIKDVNVLKSELGALGLQVCNQWFGFRLTALSYAEVEKEFVTQLNFLRLLGANIIGGAELGSKNRVGKSVPILGKREFFNSDDWKKITSGMDKLGKIAASEGFRLCYHTHMGMGIQTIKETQRLMESTNPDFVFLNYDCGHFYFAGDDHLLALDQFISRIAHIHLKDIRLNILEQVKTQQKSFLDAVKMGVFTVPSDGVIDFIPIIDRLKSIDYSGWLVVEAEQDPIKANPLQYAQKAMSYLTDILA